MGAHFASGEREALESALEGHCADLTTEFRRQAFLGLTHYAEAIAHWGGRMNLVSPRDLDHIPSSHLVPAISLRAAVRTVCHQRVADVGSGAGLPGIPLAITLPRSTFFLLESRRKRVSFLRHAVRELRLDRVHVIHTRAEGWRPETTIDLAVSRALGSPGLLTRLCSGWIAPNGFLLTTAPPGPHEVSRNCGPYLITEQRRAGNSLWLLRPAR